jgi:hypothetical protein
MMLDTHAPRAADLMDELESATDTQVLTRIARSLAATSDARTVETLLTRLGDCGVPRDQHVETAFCEALSPNSAQWSEQRAADTSWFVELAYHRNTSPR